VVELEQLLLFERFQELNQEERVAIGLLLNQTRQGLDLGWITVERVMKEQCQIR
jgi:hypothetical protein